METLKILLVGFEDELFEKQLKQIYPKAELNSGITRFAFKLTEHYRQNIELFEEQLENTNLKYLHQRVEDIKEIAGLDYFIFMNYVDGLIIEEKNQLKTDKSFKDIMSLPSNYFIKQIKKNLPRLRTTILLSRTPDKQLCENMIEEVKQLPTYKNTRSVVAKEGPQIDYSITHNQLYQILINEFDIIKKPKRAPKFPKVKDSFDYF